MKSYVKVYWWNVINEIKDGKEVFFIDKEWKRVTSVEDVSAGVLIRVLRDCEKEDIGKYEFYYIEEVEEGEVENA